MTQTTENPHAGVINVVLAYAFFAALWILLSDRVIGALRMDPQTLVLVNVAKGWCFVAVTALLLYFLVRRLTGDLAEAHARELAYERDRKQPPPMLVAIADASSDAIFAKDEQGRYLLFNNAAARFVGKSAEELIGKDDRVVFPADQAERLMAKDRRVREGGRVETAEEVLRTVDGERVFLATKGPLRGPDGRVFGTYGISRDITDRKRAEDELRRVADDLRATLQAIPDQMYELDGAGRFLHVRALEDNRSSACSVPWIGRCSTEVLPAEAADTVMKSLAAARKAGSDFGRTMVLPTPKGDCHFELSVARKPMLGDMGDRFIVLSRDITARRAAEAELHHRNEELERFNRAATDREIRMVALKQEVNELASALGRPPPYDISFVDAHGAQGAR